jgi:inosose dehydratase
MNSVLDRLAGAPISWGVCEVPGWGHQLDPARVLEVMRRLGLRATELGPEGYLPSEPAPLRGLLAAHGLRAAGGFIPVVLHRPELLEAELARATSAADLLSAAGCDTLVLAAATAGTGYKRSAELEAEEWPALASGLERLIELTGARGLKVALHPHFGTVVESPRAVERVLESSPVSLCIDTGHLLIGGADPIEVARAAAGRVAHVHLKDAAGDLAEQVRGERIGYREAVRGGLYRPLGEGDVDVAAIVRLLEGSGYAGWYVLEQDTVLETAAEGERPARDAAASLEFLQRVEGAAFARDGGNGGSGTGRRFRGEEAV